MAAGGEHLLDDRFHLVALGLRVLTDELAQLVVGHLDAGVVGDRLERELARDRASRLGAQALLELLRCQVRDREVGIRGDAPPFERLDETGEKLARPDLDERAGRLDVRSLHERVGGGGAELRLPLLGDLLADPLLEVGAQLGQGVELAGGARQVVVDRREDLLLHVLERDLDGCRLSVGELDAHLLGLARRHGEEALLDLLEHAAGADLDDVVALGLTVLLDEIDDDGVAGLYRPVGGCELGDGEAKRLDLLVDELRRNFGVGVRDLELLPVGDLDLRLDVDRRGEAEVLVRRVRQLVVVLGPGDRPDARSGEGVAVPAFDVALDRLRVEPFLPDPRDEHLHRHLPFAEAGDLDRRREIGGRVLDRVLDVVTRDVDGQANLVLGQLLHACRHTWRIVAMGLWAAVAVMRARGLEPPRSNAPPGPKPGASTSSATPAANQG